MSLAAILAAALAQTVAPAGGASPPPVDFTKPFNSDSAPPSSFIRGAPEDTALPVEVIGADQLAKDAAEVRAVADKIAGKPKPLSVGRGRDGRFVLMKDGRALSPGEAIHDDGDKTK